LHYIFAIDVSWSSVRCGVVQEAVNGLREIFYGKKTAEGEGEARGGLPEGAKVAILTFDKSVQFYNLKVSTFLQLEPYSLRSSTDTAHDIRLVSNKRKCSSFPISAICLFLCEKVSSSTLSNPGEQLTFYLFMFPSNYN
jgi:hypothetical protein